MTVRRNTEIETHVSVCVCLYADAKDTSTHIESTEMMQAHGQQR